ncbi:MULTISPECIES: glycerol kinase GlpK [Marinifilum]|uniref:Glycerol kinase n=1 Tax=Marinifilum flexuosum TaxID=1117708 RepID=A0A419X3C2_9BACT|nr:MULTISPECIES: glycerol kinase GlpK [Marinifilum]MCY1636141.1 glycerol kinase GlpK [Marinifilum sp. D737]RKE02266.1 glycerol kinase [Marinifilum flexuosum]
MEDKFILALDQGTTSSRAIVFNKKGEMVSVAQKEFTQIFPQPGWVEHDANEIWSTQAGVAAEAITQAGANGKNIAGIGITNQRETTVVWDRETNEPIYNAIVWQDRRTSKYCDELKAQGHADMIQDKTGLIIDSYFSGTKVKWILDNVEGAREKAEAGKLAFGTIDSWLIWKLTQGKVHVTDVTNASRTLLYNIKTLEWDKDMLELLDIPASILPEVKSSSEVYGHTVTTLFAHEVPIAGIAGDQQAATFGQMCIKPGSVKNTYGTGCFMLCNTGTTPVKSNNNLLTTIGWQINGETTYCLEGSIFMGGAIVQWLRDGLGIIKSSPEVEELAGSVEDNGGVFLVPALTGLGAPHWDQYARGTIVGLTRGSTSAHIARAALEGIAFQTRDVLKAMEADAGIEINELRVDGGAAINNLLMQFQSDVLDAPVYRPKTLETTALGAAYLAGLAVGYWDSVDEIKSQWAMDRKFEPEMPKEKSEKMIKGWDKALGRSKDWDTEA